jgi:hypothetical protein
MTNGEWEIQTIKTNADGAKQVLLSGKKLPFWSTTSRILFLGGEDHFDLNKSTGFKLRDDRGHTGWVRVENENTFTRVRIWSAIGQTLLYESEVRLAIRKFLSLD